jgi:SRSO17 transposase
MVFLVMAIFMATGGLPAIAFEPYTPAHHLCGGKADPKFRTKLKIAAQLVERALADGIRFRAVVAYSFYGEDEDLKRSLSTFLVASRAYPAPARNRGVSLDATYRIHTGA